MAHLWRITISLALLALAAAAGGCDEECNVPAGCSSNDCTYGMNECGGAVYECDEGDLVQTGHCDRVPADAWSKPDAGDECRVPAGCSWHDCTLGVNECGGAVYECIDGELVETGDCDPSPPDGGPDGR